MEGSQSNSWISTPKSERISSRWNLQWLQRRLGKCKIKMRYVIFHVFEISWIRTSRAYFQERGYYPYRIRDTSFSQFWFKQEKKFKSSKVFIGLLIIWWANKAYVSILHGTNRDNYSLFLYKYWSLHFVLYSTSQPDPKFKFVVPVPTSPVCVDLDIKYEPIRIIDGRSEAWNEGDSERPRNWGKLELLQFIPEHVGTYLPIVCYRGRSLSMVRGPWVLLSGDVIGIGVMLWGVTS